LREGKEEDMRREKMKSGGKEKGGNGMVGIEGEDKGEKQKGGNRGKGRCVLFDVYSDIFLNACVIDIVKLHITCMRLK